MANYRLTLGGLVLYRTCHFVSPKLYDDLFVTIFGLTAFGKLALLFQGLRATIAQDSTG
jgi:hypothetical protein